MQATAFSRHAGCAHTTPLAARAQRRCSTVVRAVDTETVTAAKVLSLTDSAHFKTLLAETHANNELLVVDYLTTWCGPCKMVAPQVEQLAQDLEHKGLRVAKFTCDASDANKKWAMTQQIKSLPTFRVYRDGAEQHVSQVVGTKIGELRKMVEEHLSQLRP